MVKNNWYLILGLEFYPNPEINPEVIKKEIGKKKNEWSRKATMSTGGQEKLYLESADKGVIEAEILNPDMRSEMIADAKALLMTELKRVAGVGGEIEKEKVVKRIQKKFPSVNEKVIEDELVKLGVKFINKDERNSLVDKYVKKPVLKVTIEGKSVDMATSINGNDPYLQVLNHKDFYDFLCKGESLSATKGLPAQELRKRAEEKKNEIAARNNHNEESSAGSKLAQYCISTAFVSEETKKCYDDFLAWKSRDVLFKNINETHAKDRDGLQLSSEAYANYVEQLRRLLPARDISKAEDILEAFCYTKEIAVPSGTTVPIVPRCRCGAVLDETKAKCLSCGKDTFVVCPKCAVKNLNSNVICKSCGADFEDINRGIALCENAEACLERMEFDVAKLQLAQAKSLYPEYSKIADVSKRIEQIESQIGTIVKDMENACKKKEYFHAKDKLEQIRKIVSSYKNQKLEEEINFGIKTAEDQKKIAMSTTDEVTLLNACQMAYEACNDCPGIKELIAKYPPVAATELQITCNPTDRKNILQWKASVTKGQVYYVVVRKENMVPSNVDDGELVGRVSTCSIEDDMIETGKKYFYAIFTERTGITSTPLITKDPVVNYFEIAGVQAIAGNGTIKITWKRFAADASVQIERIENGKVVPLTCNNKISFMDEELENEREYQYRVYLRYQSGLETYETAGQIVKGIPICPPDPVETLIVRPGEDGKFFAEWETPEKGNIRFFYSEKKPEFKMGDAIPIEQLERSMKPLQMDIKGDGKGTFTYLEDDTIYVTAVVVYSGTAIAGNIVRTCSTGNVKINSMNLVNGKIFIDVDIPKNVTEFIVLYYNDHFPTDISDVKAKRKRFRREAVEHQHGIEISPIEQLDYYFSIFAVYGQGEDKDYSVGTNYLFHNSAKQVITYSLEVRKKLFKKPVLSVSFECEEAPFTLPDIDIMYELGRSPIYKSNARLYCQIDETIVRGNCISFELELDDDLKKGTYMKAFLRDEKLAQKYQLRIQSGTNLQIT